LLFIQKTFKEVSRIQVAFSLYEIIVPATSKCPLFFGEMIEENKVQEVLEGSSAENNNPDVNDENDGIYIVIGLQPIVKSTNIYQDQAATAAEQKEAKKKQKYVPSDPQTLVLYKIRQQQVRFVITKGVIKNIFF
jgi:hypothetical protein